jgi:hypothetical protein
MIKQFLKENIEITIALALPLLLIALFLLWQGTISATVKAPTHDFLVASDYYEPNSPLVFSLRDDKPVVRFRYNWKEDNRQHNYNRNVKLWRVHVEDMSMEEIQIETPLQSEALTAPREVELDVPALSNLKVVNRMPGPDGYTYDKDRRRGGDTLLLDIFSSRSYRSTPALTKGGRIIEVNGLNKYNSEFIGWIVEE